MKNVGVRDGQVRLVLGLSLFLMAYFSGGAPHWILLLAGVLLVTTAFLRFCPVWFGLKINTHFPPRGK